MRRFIIIIITATWSVFAPTKRFHESSNDQVKSSDSITQSDWHWKAQTTKRGYLGVVVHVSAVPQTSGLVCRGPRSVQTAVEEVDSTDRLHTTEQEEEWGGPADGAVSCPAQRSREGDGGGGLRPPSPIRASGQVGRISGFFFHCCSSAWGHGPGRGSELVKGIAPKTWKLAFISFSLLGR